MQIPVNAYMHVQNVSEDTRQTIVTNKIPPPSERYFLRYSFSIIKKVEL